MQYRTPCERFCLRDYPIPTVTATRLKPRLGGVMQPQKAQHAPSRPPFLHCILSPRGIGFQAATGLVNSWHERNYAYPQRSCYKKKEGQSPKKRQQNKYPGSILSVCLKKRQKLLSKQHWKQKELHGENYYTGTWYIVNRFHASTTRKPTMKASVFLPDFPVSTTIPRRRKKKKHPQFFFLLFCFQLPRRCVVVQKEVDSSQKKGHDTDLPPLTTTAISAVADTTMVFHGLHFLRSSPPLPSMPPPPSRT